MNIACILVMSSVQLLYPIRTQNTSLFSFESHAWSVFASIALSVYEFEGGSVSSALPSACYPNRGGVSALLLLELHIST
jgi:hypothetical protein